ncbi:MAG: FkbM family methyltransferase [Ruminococcus sp.]|nr:FkbM family methyltransferase [Ruminococcus sp.]
MADEFDKTNLEKLILELNKLVVFRYRDKKMTPKQKMTYSAVGWYVDSFGEALWETIQKLVLILDELSSQNTKLHEELQASLEMTAIYKQTLDTIAENVRNLNNERLQLLQRLTELESRADKSEEKLASYSDTEEWIRNVVDEHNARFDTVDRRLDENNARLDTVDKRLDENNKRFDEHDKRLDENNARFDEYNRRLDENNARFDEHNRRLDENNARFDEHNRRLDENNARFDEHNRRLDENNARFDEHNRRLDENNARFDTIDKRLDENNIRFDDHDRHFDSSDRRIGDIESREEWTRKRFEEHDRQIDLLSHSLSGISEGSANSFSQSGEDMISEYVLKFLKMDISKISYLDLGANHAKELSNTYKFYKSGGHGVLVEANPELIPELMENRKNDIVLNRVIVPSNGSYKSETDFYVLSGDGLSTLDYNSALEACRANPQITIKQKYSVKTISVAEILDRYFSDGMDILNIDLEGIEYSILKEFDFSKVRPKIIILESIEYKPYLVMEKTLSKKSKDLLENNDYIEYAFTGINSIFIDKTFANEVNYQIQRGIENEQ